jgi:hypothetical protein
MGKKKNTWEIKKIHKSPQNITGGRQLDDFG